MSDQWFYVEHGETRGPISLEVLAKKLRTGDLKTDTLVWREGLPEWASAATIAELSPTLSVPSVGPSPPAVPTPPPPGGTRLNEGSGDKARGLFEGIGARISQVSELPTISSMPVRDILVGGLQQKAGAEDIEEEFIVGTRSTTPPLSSVSTTWPTPRVFWRVLLGAIATYLLLYIGISQFSNINFVPGLIVIGSFVVPFAVVILFFELNVPRNVSIYQVGKMLMLGGALSLITTMFLFGVIPGSGVGALIPAMLTGVVEETGKALALLLVVRSSRYPWQLNGLLFGAAVGAGFAGFESAGYAFRAALGGGMDAAIDNIFLRALLSPGGHVIWTAIVGSAIWRVKKGQSFHPSMLVHRDVIRRWAIVVVLHGLWDADLFVHAYIKLAVLVIVGWYLVFAVLKQGMDEIAEAQSALAQ